MKRLFCLYALAIMCGAMTLLFCVLCFTQSFVNIVFVLVFFSLTKWPLDRIAELKMELAPLPDAEVPVPEVKVIEKEVNQDEQYRKMVEELNEFYTDHEDVLCQLRKKYWMYIQLYFQEDNDLPAAYSAATEKMMLLYGDDIYTAFRSTQPGAMCCLSLTMNVANIQAAKSFVSKIRS